jgi:WD40 repeat protein/tRNA A-37 threonylcarbamoyl transferase component Bud32
VLSVLGRGGMGVVFRADDPALKRAIALKVIKPELVASAEARTRFLHEAQALAALEHDHIVTVYQVGTDNGVPFLAMPLLRGQTLQQRLDQAGGPLPLDAVLRCGREIAAGLAVAHARGLIHRDIKPGNVWMELDRDPGAGDADSPASTGRRERVKLLDFGLVHAVCGDGVGEHESGRILGTPAYMAPEQARGGPVDGRADLFSLGCVLYQMATGRVPFEAGDLPGLLASVAVDEPAPPRQLNPDVPDELERLITRLMRKQPEERPASAQVVVAALEAIEEARRPKLSRRRWLLGTAAAVLVAAGLAAWGVYHWLPPATPPAAPGEVTFDYDEPDARLALRLGDEPERVIDLKLGKAVSLPPGDYELLPVAAAGKRSLWPRRVLVKSGENQLFIVRLVGEVARHRRHSQPIRGLAVATRADGPLVLSVSDDRTLVAWNPAGGDKPKDLWHRDSPLRCVAVAPDGRTAATGSFGVGPRAVNVIRFWDLEKGELQQGELKCASQIIALAYSPDGNWLLSGENDGTLRRWESRTREVKGEQLRAHGGLGVLAIAFLPDGKHFLTGGRDGAVMEWNAADLTPVRTLASLAEPVGGLTVLPGGNQAVSAGLDATVRVWDLATGKVQTEWTVPAPVQALAVSPDGKRLVTGDTAGAIRLVDLATRQEIIPFSGHAQGVTAVAFTPDGRRAVTGGGDGAVCLWELPQ